MDNNDVNSITSNDYVLVLAKGKHSPKWAIFISYQTIRQVKLQANDPIGSVSVKDGRESEATGDNQPLTGKCDN